MTRLIRRLDLATGRIYDGPAGHLPSVTTILRATQPDEDRERLDAWRDRVGHEEAERIRKAGAARGTQLHRDAEDYYAHGLDPDSPWFTSIQWILDELEPEAVERMLYCERFRYAGTVDAIGRRGEFRAVCDWTTSSRPKRPEYVHDKFVQCAAYDIAQEAGGGAPADEYIVGVALEDRPAQLFTAVLGDVRALRDEWMRRLARYLGGL